MPHPLMIRRLAGSLLALAALAAGAEAQTAPAPAATSTAQQAPAAQPVPPPPPPAVQQPNVWEQFKSGQALAAGDGVAKDPAAARQIFEQVMASDNAQAAGAAALALAKLAAADLKDPELAVKALERGIELGSPWCMITRAQELAKGTAADQKRAEALYLRAMEADRTQQVEMAASNGLGQLYLGPALLSARKATAYHQRSAELGNGWSLIALGGMYDKGTGTKRSWARARDYYEKAYGLDTPQVKGAAAYALAQLYSQPAHAAPKKAFDYLLAGHRAGNPWAGMMLADRYAKGLGVKKSTATARRLYTELRNGPDPVAARAAALQLGRLYSEGPQRNLRLAEQNFSIAVKQGDVWAAYFLAKLYLDDMPSKANRAKARALLKTLAKSDDPTGRKTAEAMLKQMR